MSHRTVIWAMVILASGVSASAQTEAPEREGGFGRIFSSYKAPDLPPLGAPRKDTLEARVQDGKLNLSAADVVQLALENNADIQVERFTPYYNLWSIEKSRGVLNPSISFSTTQNKSTTPATSVLQGVDPLKETISDYSVTGRKPFVFGLDLEGTFTESRVRSNSPFYTFNPSFSSGFDISLTQHLLRDFGSISRGRFLRISRLNHDISEQDFAVRVADILRSVLDTYWELVYLQQDVTVKEDGLKLAQVVLDQNKAQLDAGTLAQLDVTQAEAEVAARDESLVAARYAKRITEDQLKNLLSSNQDPGLIVAEILPTSQLSGPVRGAVDLAQAIQRALDQAPEVRRSTLDLETKRIDVDFTRNQLKPSLDLIGRYSQDGLGGIRVVRDYTNGIFNAPIVGTVPGGLDDSISRMLRARYKGYLGAVNFSIVIGNDEARASNAQARIALAQAEERLRSTKQSIALQVRDAAERIERDRARIASAEVTVRFNEQRLSGEQEKATQGESTTRFVLETQRDLQEARSRLARARSDAIKSQIAFDRAVGDLLTTQGVKVQEQLPLR